MSGNHRSVFENHVPPTIVKNTFDFFSPHFSLPPPSERPSLFENFPPFSVLPTPPRRQHSFFWRFLFSPYFPSFQRCLAIESPPQTGTLTRQSLGLMVFSVVRILRMEPVALLLQVVPPPLSDFDSTLLPRSPFPV